MISGPDSTGESAGPPASGDPLASGAPSVSAAANAPPSAPTVPGNSPPGTDVQGRSAQRPPWSEGAAPTLEVPLPPGEAIPAPVVPNVPLAPAGLAAPGDPAPAAPAPADPTPSGPAPPDPEASRPAPRVISSATSGLYAEIGAGLGELRVDTDGPDPLMVASGVIVGGLADRLNWIANLAAVAAEGEADVARWAGEIWYKEGTAALLPHQHVEIAVGASASEREATVRFSGGIADRIRTYRRRSTGFHEVEFEFDSVEGVEGVTAIDTGDHPNRPPGLPVETLTIEDAYRRAGFDTRITVAGPSVPLALAGADAAWSNTELHDAMQTYWSRFASTAQWSMWVLFAARHEEGPDMGGIMFDDIGPTRRQGSAIFNDSFISHAPDSDPAKDAWVRRMRFWTAVHEMGHAFNMCHSWQKTIGTAWIPVANEPEVRSFMNYPSYVKGGQTAFFSDFAYRFSDQELLLLRHAPERFVEMGSAPWFDDHGFRQAEVSPEPRLRLTLRVNRPQAVFDFLEPCMVELKLENISGDVQLVGSDVLAEAEHMVVIIKKDGAPARQWLPFAQQCRNGRRAVLHAGASVYAALFLGAGRNGWDLAGPGLYTVQVTMRAHGEDHVSNPLRLKILTPEGRDDERLAQDLFTQDVGRVLAFDGSRVLDGANAVLQEAIDRMPARPIARHALIALHRPLMHAGKVLRMPDRLRPVAAPAATIGGAITTTPADPAAAREGLERALFADPVQAAQTLGNIEYKGYADRLVDDVASGGDTGAAIDLHDRLRATLEARQVAPAVLAQADGKRAALAAAKA